MSALSIQPTYPIFTETDGQPLENGYIWIGTVNLDPQVNPINVYWDAALTISAPQPIRTINGYPSRNGTPGRLYVNSDYSIRVMNRNGSTVYSAPEATERYNDAVVAISSAAVNFTQAGAGAVTRTVQSKLREVEYSITDFGAVPGVDIVANVNTALLDLGTTNPATLVIPTGDWQIASTVDWSSYKNVTFVIENGAVINHGANNITFPTNVETGTSINNCFVGSGTVTVKNKDVFTLTPPPGGWLPYSNFAMGVNALKSNTEGTNNYAWGANALTSNTLGSSNIAIGNDALKSVVGTHTIPTVGTFTPFGWNNICIGDSSGRDITTGFENLAIGQVNLQQLTTGYWNVAIGHDSQITNQTGSANISLGPYSLVTNQGSNNVAIGWAALEGQETGSNIAIGHVAMNGNRTGSLNVAIGANSLFTNTSGDENVVVGVEAAGNIQTGDANVAIGRLALASANGASSNNTAVGWNAMLTAAGSQVNNTAIGSNTLTIASSGAAENTAVGAGSLNTLTTYSNCSGLGLNSQVTGSNQVQLGDFRTTTYAYGAVQNRSDVRDKTDVQDTTLGLSFIKALRPVDYRYDLREYYRIGAEPLSDVVADGSKKRTRFHHGLIAQEVKAACDSAGIDFGGFQDHKVKGGDDVMSLGYEEFIAPLIKAVQELSAEVEALKAKIN